MADKVELKWSRDKVEDLIMRLRARAVEPGVMMRWAEDFNAAADALGEMMEDHKWPEPEVIQAPIDESKPLKGVKAKESL